MADYSHTGGSAFTNEDKLPDSVKNNAVTASSVKSLDTGHNETSLKAQMASEMNALMNANGSLLENLLGKLLGGAITTVGKLLEGAVHVGSIIIGGVIEIGSAIIGGAIDAVGNLFGWIGSGIVSLLPGAKPPTKPLPPVYSDIRTNLEGEIQPFVDEFNRQGELVDEAHENIETLQVDYEAQSQRVDQYITDTDAKIEAIGDVDAKIADKATAILEEVEVAQTTAEDGVERAKAINLALTGNTEGNLAEAVNDANTTIGAISSTAYMAYNRVPVGASLIQYVPYSDPLRPEWSMFPGAVEITEGLPEGISVGYMAPAGTGTVWAAATPTAVATGTTYYIEFWAKADEAGSRVYMELRDQNGNLAVDKNTINGSANNYPIGNVLLPNGTWQHFKGTIAFKPGVETVKFDRLFFQHPNGSTRPNQYFAGFKIYPDIPVWTETDQINFNNAVSLFTAAQSKVNNINQINWETQAERNALQGVIDTAQNNSIDALARAVRLAFPDINLLPYLNEIPMWYMGAIAWVSQTSISSNLPPVDKRSDPRTYIVRGSGVQNKTTKHAIDLPKDVREFRLRGYVRAASGFFPTVRVLDAANQDLITAWRNTAPRNDDAISENFASGWVSTPNAGGGPMNADSVTDWVLYDQVVRIKDGAEKGWITLTTPSTSDSAYVHGLRMSVFYPVQAEVDFGQQQAINGLKKMIDINKNVTDELKKVTEAQGTQLGMLREIQKTQGEMVMRSMVMNLNSTVSSYLDDDGVFFRVYNNDNNVEVRALNTTSSWVGKAIFTLVFGTQHETAITQFSVPEGTSRNKIVSTQQRQYRKMARLDWWVYAQVQKRAGRSDSVEIVAPLGWSTLTDHNFTVQTTTDHIMDFSVDWKNTTRNGKVYGIRIRRNGTILKELSEKNIGPNFPWESGLRTQSIMWSGNLTAGQSITFEVYTGSDGTSAPTDSQRTLGKRSNVITWMEDRKD